MKLRTEIEKINVNLKINHSSKGLLLGSCFAENMTSRLERLKFNVCSNPFGILYNPASICQCIERLCENREFNENELFSYNSLWHSELHHGDFSCEDASESLDKINTSYKKAVKHLKESDYVVITLGTAWIYRSVVTAGVVSNCHKRPSKDFTRERLTVGQIVEMFSKLFSGALKDKKILLTVSPIRHIKDGLSENSLSKSTLIVAAHTLKENYPNMVDYFPAYEIINDDLRDYRFYKTDMLHPSTQAVDYVWEKFAESCFSGSTMLVIKQLEPILRASEHRVLKPNSESHKLFCVSILEKIALLKLQNPELDLSSYEQQMASFLKN